MSLSVLVLLLPLLPKDGDGAQCSRLKCQLWCLIAADRFVHLSEPQCSHL